MGQHPQTDRRGAHAVWSKSPSPRSCLPRQPRQFPRGSRLPIARSARRLPQTARAPRSLTLPPRPWRAAFRAHVVCGLFPADLAKGKRVAQGAWTRHRRQGHVGGTRKRDAPQAYGLPPDGGRRVQRRGWACNASPTSNAVTREPTRTSSHAHVGSSQMARPSPTRLARRKRIPRSRSPRALMCRPMRIPMLPTAVLQPITSPSSSTTGTANDVSSASSPFA